MKLVQNSQRMADGEPISEWELKVWTDSIQSERSSKIHQATKVQQKKRRKEINGWRVTSARFHDGLKQAMSRYRNSELTTAEIRKIVEHTPGLADHAQFIYPSDHCINHTNKGACWCALTDKAIFKRIRRGVFFIRNMA